MVSTMRGIATSLYNFNSELFWVLRVEREVVKALKLNLLPLSRNKERLLSELFNSVVACCNDVLSITKSKSPKNFAILHNTSYYTIKQKYNLHSQILVDCIHQVWENLKTNPDEFGQVPIRFNIPRSGNFRWHRYPSESKLPTLDGRS